MRFPKTASDTLRRQNYENMPETVQWAQSSGDPEIPGHRQYGSPTSIPARKRGVVTLLGGDRVSNLIVSVPGEYVVEANDKLDGAEVIEVVGVRDQQGSVMHWRCYAKE